MTWVYGWNPSLELGIDVLHILADLDSHAIFEQSVSQSSLATTLGFTMQSVRPRRIIFGPDIRQCRIIRLGITLSGKKNPDIG